MLSLPSLCTFSLYALLSWLTTSGAKATAPHDKARKLMSIVFRIFSPFRRMHRRSLYSSENSVLHAAKITAKRAGPVSILTFHILPLKALPIPPIRLAEKHGTRQRRGTRTPGGRAQPVEGCRPDRPS